MKTRPIPVLLLILLVFTSILAYSGETAQPASKQPPLPSLAASVNIVSTRSIGPGKPVVVYPGESFVVELDNPVDVVAGFIHGVFLENHSLELRNYTVKLHGSNKTYTVTIPQTAKSGLYDLTLIGRNTSILIPRSVWIIAPGVEKLRIAHITDLHYGSGYPNETIGSYKRFTGLLLVQLLGVDVVLNTGDEADTAARLEYVESRAFRYSFAYPIPYFLIPGNHDAGTKNFEQYYGDRVWYRVIDGKYLVFGGDTGEEGFLSWEQLKLLTEILEQYKSIPVKIIMIHHPVFYWQGELCTRYDSGSLQDPRNYRESPLSYYWGTNITATRYFLKLVEDYNVTYVLSGHIHRDQYVRYVSTRTNGTTYFITTTTLAQSRPLYNGLQVLEITPGNPPEFPYKTSLFTGFKNTSRDKVYNAIPVEILANGIGFYGVVVEAPHAYYFSLYNNLGLDLSNTVLLALPWSGSFYGFQVLDKRNGGLASIVDARILDNTLYIALNITLPGKEGMVEFIVYNMLDTSPPNAVVYMTIPETPVIGRPLKVYLKLYDDEWGLRNVTAWHIVGDEVLPVELRASANNTYVTTLNLTGYSEPVKTLLRIIAYDYAGHILDKNITIEWYPPGWKRETTTTTATTATTLTSTTPSPATTPAQSPIQATPSLQSPVAETTVAYTTTTQHYSTLNNLNKVAIIVLAVVAILLTTLILLRKR